MIKYFQTVTKPEMRDIKMVDIHPYDKTDS